MWNNWRKSWNYIINTHYKLSVIYILLFAYILRLVYDYVLPGGLSLDARSYYTAAINIVNGYGYSDHTEAPFLPFYFREPLTSYTIALFVGLNKTIQGLSKIDYPTVWIVKEMAPIHQHIIFSVQAFSAFLQVFGLALFAKLIKRYTCKTAALIFLLISAVYFPLIIYSSLLLREVYVFFLLLVFTYFWEGFIRTKKNNYLIASALSSGIICMFLHLYWIMLLIIIPFFFIHCWRNRKGAISKSFAFIIIFFLPSMPWVYRVYQYYPDIRVAKTLGAALTVDYTNALNAYRAHGVDPYSVKQGDMGDIEVKADIFSIADASKNFQYAFDGTYKKEAARINATNTTGTLFNYYLYRIGLAFRNTVFIVGITYDYELFFGNFSPKEIAKFIFVIPYIIMGILALCGLGFILKKYWILMPAFLYNALFFFAYGDEERRQYVLVPWIIIMAMYFIWFLIRKYKKENL